MEKNSIRLDFIVSTTLGVEALLNPCVSAIEEIFCIFILLSEISQKFQRANVYRVWISDTGSYRLHSALSGLSVLACGRRTNLSA